MFLPDLCLRFWLYGPFELWGENINCRNFFFIKKTFFLGTPCNTALGVHFIFLKVRVDLYDLKNCPYDKRNKTEIEIPGQRIFAQSGSPVSKPKSDTEDDNLSKFRD